MGSIFRASFCTSSSSLHRNPGVMTNESLRRVLNFDPEFSVIMANQSPIDFCAFVVALW